MSWNYSVRLRDPDNVGGSADAALVYDLEQALGVWAQYILGVGTLVVDLVIENTAVGRATGASTSSHFVGTNAQGLNIFEPSSLYELTTGQHVSGTTSDITITVSPAYFSNLDLDYGLTYNSDVPSNKYNPIVVFLHELMHGFGMAGAFSQAGNLPGNYEFTFDTFVTKTSGGAYFTGANAIAAYGGPVPLTTSSSTQNYYHFGNQQSDIAKTPSSVQDPQTLDLMNGIVFFYDYQYQISALDLGVLKDLGYSIRTAPVITAHDATATRGQSFSASSLFSGSVAAGDTITGYALWSSNGSGHWVVNGVSQGTGVEIDISAAQLAQTAYQSGSGSDQLWARAYDGVLWGDWKPFTVTAPIDGAPVMYALNVQGMRGQTSVAASSLLSATDSDGDAITKYALWDTEGNGHWTVNGAVQGTNTEIDIAASDLSTVSYVFGAATDHLYARAFDGVLWSPWRPFVAIPYINHVPVAVAPDFAATHTQNILASNLFNVADADNDLITNFQLWDSTNDAVSGHWVVAGVAQGANAGINITAAQLAQTTFQAGLIPDDLWVREFDGTFWSDWKEFHVNPPPDRAPIVTAPTYNEIFGQFSVPASSLFSASDPDGDAIVQYSLWSEGNGQWVVNGVAQAAGVIFITAAQLAQTSFSYGTGGTNSLYVRASDGLLWSPWAQISVIAPVDDPPIVTPVTQAVSATHNQVFAASSLFTASDPEGDAVTKYSLWDTEGNGHWIVNGVVQPTNREIVVTAAELANTVYQSGSGTDHLYVRATSWLAFGAWSAFTVTGPADLVPVVIAADMTAAHGQTSIAASNLFSVTDADGDAITNYQFWDSTSDSTSGHFVVGGAAKGTNQSIDVSAAQLSSTTFQTGSVSDDLWVRAFDGSSWSNWKEFHVNPAINHAPVAAASDFTATHNQIIAASSLFSASDADNDTIITYHLWDSSADPSSGHWMVGGAAQAANQSIEISAAQLAGTTFQSGSGSDDLWVQAYDGAAWSAWKEFHVNAPIDHAPVVTASDFTATHNQNVAASSLFGVTDADNDTITTYQFWDSTPAVASGHFVVGGVAQGAGQGIDVSAAQLSSTTFQSGSGSDDLWVRAFDGISWSSWKEFHVNAPVNHAPVAVAADQTVAQNSSRAVSSLFSVTDADNDTITAYHFWDSTADAASGHFAIGGTAQGANQNINVTAAQLSQATFQTGTVADDLWVQAFDGTEWSAWKEFHILV